MPRPAIIEIRQQRPWMQICAAAAAAAAVERRTQIGCCSFLDRATTTMHGSAFSAKTNLGPPVQRT